MHNVKLRIKGYSEEEIDTEVAIACKVAREYGIRLWVNDHSRSAIKHCAWGVHLGQEDLEEVVNFKIKAEIHQNSGDGCYEGLHAIAKAGLCLGIR